MEIEELPGFVKESTHVFIGQGPGQQLAARITIHSWPGLVEEHEVADTLDKASIHLAKVIAERFSKIHEV